jgi:hypothetical protein
MSMSRNRGPTVRPTVPTVVGISAFSSSTAAPVLNLPANVANDIIILVIETSNENIATPTGYSQIGPQNGIGASATGGSVRGAVFWKRSNGAESDPTIADSGDHTASYALIVRGCPTSGDPFRFLGNVWKFTASTTGTSPTGTTHIDNCLIMDVFFQAIDAGGAHASGHTNASLTNLTEQVDAGTAAAAGGGICIVTGTKATAGTVNATTLTWDQSTVDICTRIAFVGADTVQVCSAPRPSEVYRYIGSAPDLDDAFVIPSGAKMIFAQVLDGGGGGSGGRSSATAEGGGGGGGGGYDEAWYFAPDLGVAGTVITVHAGKGGAGGNVDGAGNAGVLSEFDKGGSGPLTSLRRVAGTAATAAITADGGNGGCGSGRGTASPAVSTTRRTLTSQNAAAAFGAIGAAGGSGTTSPVGGSEGDWGGGGGESGADTDAGTTPANNGSSMRGAGGGGGGRTNTNVGQGGNGGGAANASATQGAAGTTSTRFPYGGSGGNGGGSSVAAGGAGGFPGGGGGGGGGVASGTGGAGAAGAVQVTVVF